MSKGAEIKLTTLSEHKRSEHNSVLWNSGREEDKQTVRDRKRRLHYVSNIEVISDSGNPDNDGKVFRYKYGKKIFDKIMDVMQPQFADEKPVNPFDFWTGANFKLKIRNVEGYRNYDKSEFDSVSAHRGGDEDQLKSVYENLYSLAELVDPKNFKPYAELKTKFLQVIDEDHGGGMQMPVVDTVKLDETAEAKSVGKVASEDTGSSDTLSYFAKLAAE